MYTGSDTDLQDLQKQITDNLNAANASIAGLQTQIKQVTLSLESSLKVIKQQFTVLQNFVNSRLP